MSPQDFCQDGWKAKAKNFLPGNSRRNGFGIAFFTRIVQLGHSAFFDLISVESFNFPE